VWRPRPSGIQRAAEKVKRFFPRVLARSEREEECETHCKHKVFHGCLHVFDGSRFREKDPGIFCVFRALKYSWDKANGTQKIRISGGAARMLREQFFLQVF